ncbi:MAG TPA: tetratricopeptide repeat protein [Verrucomicrobiae bacterium]|nr:tetratricopeptide repeat protein [Verrucomicrobiae bacterium]
MKTTCNLALLTLVLSAPAAWAQTPAATASPSGTKASAPQLTVDQRAEAYSDFASGHLAELQYDMTGNSDQADQAIALYKKALAITPDSSVIHERLAEVYAKTQRLHEATIEAQTALQIDPDNVSAHRVLARIYVHQLGDVNTGQAQTDDISKAIEQFAAIQKLQPYDVSSALWLARLYRFENRHEEAEKVLRGVLQRNPDSEQALEQLSQLLIDGGRSQEAIQLLQQSTADGASPEVYDLLGDAYSQAKDYPNAEKAYQQAVAEDPDEPSHRHGLAEALSAQDKYAAAIEQYKKLVELEPGTAEDYLRLGQLYRRLGQYDQAESSLQRAKQLAPDSLEVLYSEALLYEDQGRYDESEKILTDAISGLKSQSSGEENPNAISILDEQLGRVYLEQGNYTAAISTYQQMSQLGPDAEKRAQMLLIDAYRQSHNLDEAIEVTRKAIAQNPKDQNLVVTLAMLYGEKGDADSGTKVLTPLLQGTSADLDIYLDLAQVQERGKKYDEAAQSANKALALAKDSPDKVSAYFMLGAICEQQKLYDQAEEQFQKALALDPNNAAVLNYYGYMLADRGLRLPEATSMIQRAVSQEPSNGAYLDSLGWAFYKQNKLTQAEEYLLKAVARESHDPTILGHLGDTYLKLGQTDQAAEVYERALAEWQKASPADYEGDKVSEVDARLKNLKRRLAQKSTPDAAKPQ